MSSIIESIGLPDGRRLDVRSSGPTDAPAVFFHHGSPGSAMNIHCYDESAHRHGLRFLTMSRAGFGNSTPRPGRHIVDVVGDTQAALDHFGVERCMFVGVSGGAPHALACAARLSGSSNVTIICGIGPAVEMGSERFIGQREFLRALIDSMQTGREQVRDLVAPTWNVSALTPQRFMSRMASRLPTADQAVVDEAYAEQFVANLQEALRQSLDGLVDDQIAIASPWGFDLAEIAIPVSVWHGTLDETVPVDHAYWLADHISNATVHIEDGEGHLSISVHAIDRVFDEMLGRPI